MTRSSPATCARRPRRVQPPLAVAIASPSDQPSLQNGTAAIAGKFQNILDNFIRSNSFKYLLAGVSLKAPFFCLLTANTWTYMCSLMMKNRTLTVESSITNLSSTFECTGTGRYCISNGGITFGSGGHSEYVLK